MEPLAKAKSSIEIKNLTLDNLECHFNWKPEYGTTSEGHLKNVIEKTERKILRHPQFTVAYRCTLAYLHASRNINDFNKAFEYLEDEKISAAKRTYKPVERWLDCDFIVRANRLKLGECGNRIGIENSNDELSQLSVLWADKRTKAAVYVIKGATLSCFGPLYIEKAIDSYKSALQLVNDDPNICSNWQKFDWLWGYAFNLSRKTRQIPGVEANPEELKIWKEAFLWKDSKKLEIRKPLFYAHFAETIMLMPTEKKKCEAMMEEAIRFWKELDSEKKRLHNLVINIAQKFCCKTHPDIGNNVRTFVEKLDLFDILGDDTDMYRRFTKSLNYEDENERAIEILEEAKKRIGLHHNLQFDLQLLARKSKLMGDEWVRNRYTSLFQKYESFSSNIAVIYVHRSKWLFHKEIYPKLILGQNRDSYDDAMLDECISDLIKARSNVSSWHLPKDFEKKLHSVLERRKFERPEYFAWFTDNFCEVEISEDDKIIKLYESVIKAGNSSLERQTFARKHLGKFYLKCHKFSKAISTFRQLATSDEECKKYFVESVLKNPDHSVEELRESLEFGNCDVIETILSILEREKKQVDVRGTLLNGKFFEDYNGTFLYFNTSHYEICAMIYLLLENEKSFFLNDAQSKSQDFKEDIKYRLDKFLDISMEDIEVVQHVWRHSRFEMVKTYLVLPKISDTQKKESMTSKLNIMILNTLRDSRCALDACISGYFTLDAYAYYPHAINEMDEFEKKSLKEGNDPSTKSWKVFVKKRLKREWLPSEDFLNPRKGVDYDVIEKLLRKVLEKKGQFAEEILKFIATREYQIIIKEAAWHDVWIKKDNAFKHLNHKRDIREIEAELNENREITKLFSGAKMTVYELANKAAEFAEQTLAVFGKTTDFGD